MASEVKTNKVSPAVGTDVILGDSSDTFTVPSGSAIVIASGGDINVQSSGEIDIASGATLDVNGTIDLTGATKTGFPSSGFHNVQFITATDPAVDLTSGTTLIVVELQGAGGCCGGIDASGYAAGTGGAGGYAMQQLTVVDTDTWNVTIGAGGVDGGTRDGGDAEFAQASGSSLGSTITAGGGGGSADPSTNWPDGGAGGTVTNANSGNKISITGGAGQSGNQGQMSTGSRWGSGGVTPTQGSGNGGNGTGYGSGGGQSQVVSTSGGSGAPALVVIWEYK